MKSISALLLTLCLLCPSAAQAQYMAVYAGATGQPSAPNNTYEFLGQGANGVATTVTAGSSANALGSYVTIGTTTSAWADLWVEVSNDSAASNRYQITLRIGGSTIIIPDLFFEGGSATNFAGTRIRIPISIAAGTLVEAAARSGTGSATINIGLIGIVANTGIPPGFTSMTALNIDTANTRPSTTDVALDNSWTQLVASTGATYKAFLVVVGDNGTAIALSQPALVQIGAGGSGSEATIMQFIAQMGVSTPYVLRVYGPLIQSTISSGTRLAVRVSAATPGTDHVRVAIYGLN